MHLLKLQHSLPYCDYKSWWFCSPEIVCGWVWVNHAFNEMSEQIFRWSARHQPITTLSPRNPDCSEGGAVRASEVYHGSGQLSPANPGNRCEAQISLQSRLSHLPSPQLHLAELYRVTSNPAEAQVVNLVQHALGQLIPALRRTAQRTSTSPSHCILHAWDGGWEERPYHVRWVFGGHCSDCSDAVVRERVERTGGIGEEKMLLKKLLLRKRECSGKDNEA